MRFGGMMRVLFFMLVILEVLIVSCGGGGTTSSNEKTDSETTQVINPEPINEPPQIDEPVHPPEPINEAPQIDEPVYPPEPPPQLTSYTKTITVKIANEPTLLIQYETPDNKVYYKKQGEFQYTPCYKNFEFENLYTCKITYYEHELNQNINVIFTYNLEFFNIADLEKIHKEESPEIVISEESTSELKNEGIVKDLGKVLVVEFPEEKSTLEDNLHQTWYLNISSCIYK